jgi:uncharacterized protein with FMN-binding domain
MRRIAIAVMTTISGLVLLFSYHTSRNETSTALADTDSGQAAEITPSEEATAGEPTIEAPDPSPTGEPSTEPTATPGTPTAKPTPSATTKATLTTKTYAGRTVGTEWGPVQVKIVVRNKKIISADVLQVPMENGHDIAINTRAVPILNQAVVDHQSADFDSVSGATVTSDGYKASLQSAIDKANL